MPGEEHYHRHEGELVTDDRYQRGPHRTGEEYALPGHLPLYPLLPHILTGVGDSNEFELAVGDTALLGGLVRTGNHIDQHEEQPGQCRYVEDGGPAAQEARLCAKCTRCWDNEKGTCNGEEWILVKVSEVIPSLLLLSPLTDRTGPEALTFMSNYVMLMRDE